MYSKELQELDRNTVRYMIDELQEDLERMQAKKEQVEAEKEQMQAELSRLKKRMAEAGVTLEE